MVDNLKLIAAVLVIVVGITVFYVFGDMSALLRALIVVVSVVAAAGVALTSTPGKNAWQFTIGTRAEIRKVIWPSRRETMQSTLIVILMVLVVGIYLWMLDALSFWAIYDLVLGLGS